MGYLNNNIIHMLVVGFFILAAADLVRRTFGLRFINEQIVPKPHIARVVLVVALAAIFGLGHNWIDRSLVKQPGPAANAPSKPSNLVKDSTANGAIGGLQWLDPSTLVIVRDSKNKKKHKFSDLKGIGQDYSELPLAIASMRIGEIKIDNVPLTTSDPEVKKLFLPSDLEAVCIPTAAKVGGEHVEVDTNTITLIASESASYQTDPGQIFLIELSEKLIFEGNKRKTKWTANVIGYKDLPQDPTKKRQVEGIDCFEDPKLQPSDPQTYSILLGYRGINAIGAVQKLTPGSILLLNKVNFGDTNALPDLSALKPVTKNITRIDTQPACISRLKIKDGDWRDIGDLHVKDDGAIWAIAAFDKGDDGPFCSTLYRMNYKIVFKSGAWVLENDNPKANLSAIDNYKVEALIGKVPGDDEFIYGYDNENLGSGIIAP